MPKMRQGKRASHQEVKFLPASPEVVAYALKQIEGRLKEIFADEPDKVRMPAPIRAKDGAIHILGTYSPHLKTEDNKSVRGFSLAIPVRYGNYESDIFLKIDVLDYPSRRRQIEEKIRALQENIELAEKMLETSNSKRQKKSAEKSIRDAKKEIGKLKKELESLPDEPHLRISLMKGRILGTGKPAFTEILIPKGRNTPDRAKNRAVITIPLGKVPKAVLERLGLHLSALLEAVPDAERDDVRRRLVDALVRQAEESNIPMDDETTKLVGALQDVRKKKVKRAGDEEVRRETYTIRGNDAIAGLILTLISRYDPEAIIRVLTDGTIHLTANPQAVVKFIQHLYEVSRQEGGKAKPLKNLNEKTVGKYLRRMVEDPEKGLGKQIKEVQGIQGLYEMPLFQGFKYVFYPERITDPLRRLVAEDIISTITARRGREAYSYNPQFKGYLLSKAVADLYKTAYTEALQKAEALKGDYLGILQKSRGLANKERAYDPERLFEKLDRALAKARDLKLQGDYVPAYYLVVHKTKKKGLTQKESKVLDFGTKDKEKIYEKLGKQLKGMATAGKPSNIPPLSVDDVLLVKFVPDTAKALGQDAKPLYVLLTPQTGRKGTWHIIDVVEADSIAEVIDTLAKRLNTAGREIMGAEDVEKLAVASGGSIGNGGGGGGDDKDKKLEAIIRVATVPPEDEVEEKEVEKKAKTQKRRKKKRGRK